MMTIDFGEWMKRQSNTIPDASEIKRDKEETPSNVDTMTQCRHKAYIYAKLRNGDPEDGNEVIIFFADYCQYLSGLEIREQFDNIKMWDTDFQKKMMDLYQALKKHCAVVD